MNKLFVIVFAILIILILTHPVFAETNQEGFTYLPLVYKAGPPSGPVWVLNPNNLPPANGFPGAKAEYEQLIDCPEPCYTAPTVESPWYFGIIGTAADVPPLGRLGENASCYGVLVTQKWAWTVGSEVNAIFFPTGHAITYWWWVPDPNEAPALEWAAQLRQKVLEQGFPGCTNPDIGLYYTP